MRYVVVCVVKDKGGEANNALRKKLWEEFRAKSSKLPAHFTIKAPFEYEGSLMELEEALEEFCKKNKESSFKLEGYEHFDDRVIYMKVNMSKEGKKVHDQLIDVLSQFPYLSFSQKDGKDKVFHVTLASKNLKPIYKEVWEYIQQYPCSFECKFDNISIYSWEDQTWKLYKEFLLG